MGYRQKCLRRKDQRCVECGAGDGIEVHHIDGDRRNNSLDNLVPMCHDCHRRVHKATGGLDRWRDKLKDETPGTALSVAVDDDVAEHAREVKDDLGLTWAEYVEAAADALEDDGAE